MPVVDVALVAKQIIVPSLAVTHIGCNNYLQADIIKKKKKQDTLGMSLNLLENFKLYVCLRDNVLS